MSNGFRRHFSTNEYDYLRGVASTVSFSGIDISLFYSSRKMDGIMNSCYIRSIRKDGINRIERE
ncbi:MAG: hypothetical protein LUH15_06505 [Tannerellaceae bacterium]|nr:hypothetical protein [Tannerellaceae bacterium]